MDTANYSKKRADGIVEPPLSRPLKIAKLPTVFPFSGSEEDYPTVPAAPDQIPVPSGGKSIKSAVMKRGKKFKAAMVNGGKKFEAGMLYGAQKSWAALRIGAKKFGPTCSIGGLQVAMGVATD